VKFTERKEFLYDAEVFKQRPDVTTALGIHSEYIRRHSPRPPPMFFEVDRRSEKFDSLWHVSLDDRTAFSRSFEMPIIIRSERPDWRLTRVGLTPLQKHKVWMGNLILQEMNYFPVRGDFMFFNGYRHMIINVVLEPDAFWQQTNVWLGLHCETCIPADGDARPLLDQSVAVPAERLQTRPLPEA
jgi:hypothetical protein